MRNLILPNFKKKVPQSEFVCKSYDRFTEAHPGYGSGRRNMTRNQNRVRQKLLFVTAKVDPMEEKAQTRCHNESRVDKARFHARWLAKANRLMWWISLLFGTVELVSSTNKAQSKILKP
jgi:hypothetical protein